MVGEGHSAIQVPGFGEINLMTTEHGRGLMDLIEWQLERDFLNVYKTFALGANEKAALTDKQMETIFPKPLLLSTPFSYMMWELFGIPLSYLTEYNPRILGRARAEEYLLSLRKAVYGLDEEKRKEERMKVFDYRDMKEIEELREDIAKERGEEKPEGIKITLSELIDIAKKGYLEAFRNVEVRGDGVYIGSVDVNKLYELSQREKVKGKAPAGVSPYTFNGYY